MGQELTEQSTTDELPRVRLSSKKYKSANELVGERITSEIVIAFCGPVGAPFKLVTQLFDQEISSNRNYVTHSVKISSLIRDQMELEDVIGETNIQRKNRYIDAGDQIRADTKQAEILAAAAISEIYKQKNLLKELPDAPERICYFIDSLKRPEEVKLLKDVYGDSFFLIGLQAPKSVRIENVSEGNELLKSSAEELIKRDYEGDKKIDYSSKVDQKKDFGQKLGKIFHKSDYFINSNGNDDEGVKQKIARFVDIIFGTRVITPNLHEKSMYAAWSAAANSACMSRQVGAAVVSPDNNIISVGWNDVPKASGGVYTTENYDLQSSEHDYERDNRCFRYGNYSCRNSQKQETIIQKLKNRIINEIEKLDIIKDGIVLENILEDSEIASSTEYSRAIHAEMHAMFSALKDHSSRVDGGSIYVTTFPCHNCARHIVLSGLMQVYYIEPYPKSLALELHPDSLTESAATIGKVKLLPFEGVAPSRYLDLFSYMDEKRKDPDTNKLKEIDPNTAMPRCQINLESIEFLEANTLKNYERHINEGLPKKS